MKHKVEMLKDWFRSLTNQEQQPVEPQAPFLNSKQRSTLKWKAKQLKIQTENYYV